jgi:hypothetical protein
MSNIMPFKIYFFPLRNKFPKFLDSFNSPLIIITTRQYYISKITMGNETINEYDHIVTSY